MVPLLVLLPPLPLPPHLLRLPLLLLLLLVLEEVLPVPPTNVFWIPTEVLTPTKARPPLPPLLVPRNAVDVAPVSPASSALNVVLLPPKAKPLPPLLLLLLPLRLPLRAFPP